MSSSVRTELAIDQLFELPAFRLPGEHREITSLVEAGRHAEAAGAIAELRFDSPMDRDRAARALGICWMRAGEPQRAEAALRSARRTVHNAWCRACALVRLDCLADAAAHVLWVGGRVPLLGGRRRAARALLEMLGRPLPQWLADPPPEPAPGGPWRATPPPYLASFFYPTRPEVPAGYEDAAAAIQRGRYAEAARRLIERGADSSRVSREVAVAVAECWLLAGEPEAAEAWLCHRLTSGGIWALICARVQRNRPQEALEALARLARRHALRGERSQAAAALVAHLGLRSLPAGLEQLEGHPYLDVRRARDAGYRRFADEVVREIGRQAQPDAVGRVVRRVESQCASIAEADARMVLVPTYDAAVRARSDPDMAERGLRWVLSRPNLLGSDEAEYSRALLFATACGRLGELRADLHRLAGRALDRQTRFACWMASAKLSLVRGDLLGIRVDTRNAMDFAASPAEERRATRLRRAARWLSPEDGPRISQWHLRQLHHLLPLGVAERLEDRDGRFLAGLAGSGSTSPAARHAVQAASRHLKVATAADAVPRARRGLGYWALHVGRALLEVGRPGEAVMFTGAARQLLGPEVPGDVILDHGRAIGIACRSLEERGHVLASLDRILHTMPMPATGSRALAAAALDAWEESRRAGGSENGRQQEDLSRLLTPASAHRPPPPLAAAAPALHDLDAIPADVLRALEECFVARAALLPDAAPFRGRLWFESDPAYERYQQGREELDAAAAHRAFEHAWVREPNNRVTIQGLILGWGRRLSEKPGRSHVLDHLARILDQMKDREVEAALAHTTLAAYAGDHGERRACLERAAAALERRVRRQPWARARDAEIALRLELGSVVAAGRAAWEESQLHRPGTPASRRYARLAAELWRRPGDPERLPGDAVQAALERAGGAELTDREAVQYAVAAGQLVTLTDLTLDDDALEDLWRLCRGAEDDLCRFLEKQGTRAVNPRPHYLRFLARKLVSVDPAGAARIEGLLTHEPTAEPHEITWLRLAIAELLTRDPLHEVATPQKQLGPPQLRELMAVLRRCAGRDDVAYSTFATAVKDALAALFDLRESAPVDAPEPYGERLARASDALQLVHWAGRRLGTPAVANVAELLFRYLALALDAPLVDAYLRQKVERLVPSRLGSRLGSWWAEVCQAPEPLDFFHLHESYRYDGRTPPEEWLRRHRVHGRPVRDAIHQMLESLETHARQLASIEEGYRSSRPRRGPARDAFGLEAELEACCRVLRRSLEPPSSPDALRDVEGALKRLGRSLRVIDLARLIDVPTLVYDRELPEDRYLLPRAPVLLEHLRRNVPSGGRLQVICEVSDGSGQQVSCLLCLDAGRGPAPESTPLRGLAPFVDLVEALGGQFHLWMVRPGDRGRCRRQHVDGLPCVAEDYVPRIEDRLRDLTATRWHSQRQALQPWLQVLGAALHAKGSATLAFVILPRLYE